MKTVWEKEIDIMLNTLNTLKLAPDHSKIIQINWSCGLCRMDEENTKLKEERDSYREMLRQIEPRCKDAEAKITKAITLEAIEDVLSELFPTYDIEKIMAEMITHNKEIPESKEGT
jgi:hypothetical protein